MNDEQPTEQSTGQVTPRRHPLPWYEDADAFPDDPEMWHGRTAQDYTLA